MTVWTVLLLVLGSAALILGAEWLVRGSSGLAAAAGISPLVIGLTVVAFGTSAPEAAVTLHSALTGRPDVAFGNVVGSNIFNILVVLGVSALFAPLAVSPRLLRVEVPLLVGVSVLVLLFGMDGRIGRFDGIILFGSILAYTFTAIRIERRKGTRRAPDEGRAGGSRRTVLDVVLLLAGLAFLVLGSKWLVEGAVAVARAWGVSELVIGLTIVAAGTSLPEVATSAMASFRGERDIAVGNAVGSSLFNLLAVLGLAGLVHPHGVGVPAEALRVDVPVMIGCAVACLPIFVTGRSIGRSEGALFLAYYVTYGIWLFLDASDHVGAQRAFGNAMVLFVLPLTAITLLVIAARSLRRARR